MSRLETDEATRFPLPVHSKQRLVVQVGMRRFESSVIFSSGKQEPLRYKRDFKLGERTLMSLYSRVAFGPCPVLMFARASDVEKYGSENITSDEQDGDENPNHSISSEKLKSLYDHTLGPLVSSGWVDKMDPFTVTLRHRILHGKIFKVHKTTSATLRHLVYNKDDAKYLKDVKLWTNEGLEGRIVNCIGTHGHMKCSFNKKPMVGQSVYMTLYKRQFPPLKSLRDELSR
eukprot:CAMPEP_0197537826 /NCGR_PEP_ID=MMETSP1318-20131121/58008_1 /TAXON_ID=552666 /ORGANISM="Partenskyella glossopodia, Strain RCC365" /LENGTH=229 /DNA_ID=CAMNT_0043096087 /DNA_START=92 /DNA_END=781 /DNA_ORIENTATION=+